MTCPICKRETQPRYRPFCSARCADVDLGNWLSGRYALPDDTLEPGDDDTDGTPENPSGQTPP